MPTQFCFPGKQDGNESNSCDPKPLQLAINIDTVTMPHPAFIVIDATTYTAVDYYWYILVPGAEERRGSHTLNNEHPKQLLRSKLVRRNSTARVTGGTVYVERRRWPEQQAVK